MAEKSCFELLIRGLLLLVINTSLGESTPLHIPSENLDYSDYNPEPFELGEEIGEIVDEGFSNGLQPWESTPYSDCGSKSVIQNVSVDQCDHNGICEIRRGSFVNFHLIFVPKVRATQLTAVVIGKSWFITKKIPVPQPNACEHSGIQCPLDVGHPYEYVLTAYVPSDLPKLKVWVTGQLVDERQELVACVKIQVRLV